MKLIALLSIFYSILAFAGPMKEISSTEEFEAYLLDAQFNGVLLIQKDQRVLYRKAHGLRDFESQVPLKITDKFQMGSITKQFVSASILKLQDQGKLSIDDDLTKHIPQYLFLKGVSIRDILNHTSGIDNYTDNKSFMKIAFGKKSLTLNDIIDFLSTLPLNFTPKTKWQYSNSGYIVAGKVVEAVSGLTWDEFISTNFLKPLKMNNTGYVEYFESVSDTRGHQFVDGKFKKVEGFNMSWALSAGALYTTVDDLALWTDIYDSSPLLSKSAKKEMQTPFLSNHGLGLNITKYKNDIKIHHGGRTPGFNSNLIYLKKAQLKVVKLDNNDGGAADITPVALDFFASGKALALKTAPFAADIKQMVDYEGQYQSPSLKMKIYFKNGQLYAFPEGQREFLLTANDIDSFRLMGFAGEEFIRDHQGKVTQLHHYQNGSMAVFKKVP